MVSRDENELLTQVGLGTPMGNVLRRYWLPALLVEELDESDGAPQRVRLLGEDLVAFRDTAGRVGLLEEFCAHRCASLFLGRNEEHGLRCVYHGWKYDVTGQCVDMPNEPAQYRFADRVHLTAYPCLELGGVIWTYMGPPDRQPSPPDFEWTRMPASHLHFSKTLQYSNYLQGVEGGIDTSHISFLHNNDLSDTSSLTRVDRSPRLEVERTSYGFRYAGIRDVGERGNYYRLYQFVMPFHQMRPAQVALASSGSGGVRQVRGHMWMPIDDASTWVFNWTYNVDADQPLTHELIEDYETSSGRGPGGETEMRHRTRANDWLIDRALQRTKTFTGITGLNTQDLAVQESMGPIVDRSREHLGTADRAVIVCRQIMLDTIDDVQQGGDPPGVEPADYRSVRSADVVLARDLRWQEAAAEALVAHW